MAISFAYPNFLKVAGKLMRYRLNNDNMNRQCSSAIRSRKHMLFCSVLLDSCSYYELESVYPFFVYSLFYHTKSKTS